jgi:glycosyltransferase involved in cell wall biosynthesis
MRILYIVTAAEYGGASLHVLRLMDADIKKGYKVGLVSAPETRIINEAKNIGAQIFINKYFVRPIQIYNDFLALWSVFRAIKKFNPDLITAHSTKAGYAARFFGFLFNKPVIFTAHGWSFTEGRGSSMRKMLIIAERIAAKFTKKIVCVSEYDRSIALKFKVDKPDKILTIHNGINPNPFLKVDGYKITKEFKLSENPIITMIGRLTPQKNPITLLKASCFLNKKFKLLIVGKGELQNTVEQFISLNNLSDLVILTGERADIPEILAASTIFVLSSLWEGLPYTIIEAMISGLPIVATSVGGIPELIENGKTGFIVPPASPYKMAEAINKLLENEELCIKMGKEGQKKALREFTLNRMITQTQDLYKEVLNKK